MDDFNKTSNIYPNLAVNISNEQQFRLNKINEIKYYFLAEIRERELISKNLSKYIASLDYFDKSLNVLSILSGRISIASFATVIRAPAGIIAKQFKNLKKQEIQTIFTKMNLIKHAFKMIWLMEILKI